MTTRCETSLFDSQHRMIDAGRFMRVTGRVRAVSGIRVETEGIGLPVGTFTNITTGTGDVVPAQIVAVREDREILVPLAESSGIAVGDNVTDAPGLESIPVGADMLGCVLDGLGRPIGAKRFTPEDHYPAERTAPDALSRVEIDEPLATGIRSIDAMHSAGRGQRLGLFAGTGVGKSVLMGMIARNTSADVTVVALVGERGREVGDFLKRILGEEGLARSVVVASTSNESPVMRVRAAFVATAVAEYFRDRGADVLLMMDSTTRVAMAQREIGLAGGEPPTTKGYPPSVFGLLPRLLERSGRTSNGSITGLYTVLVEGDDINEPVSDAMRGILDGHVWLSRDLANRGHFPAVSVLDSVSRVMPDVIDAAHAEAARDVRRTLAVWRDIEDLVNLGAYNRGAQVDFDLAVDMKSAIDAFLQQDTADRSTWAASRDALLGLKRDMDKRREQIREEHRARQQGTEAGATSGER